MFAKIRYIGTDAEMREMEQWMIDKLKEALGYNPETRLRWNSDISNMRNELGKSAREKLRATFEICKP